MSQKPARGPVLAVVAGVFLAGCSGHSAVAGARATTPNGRTAAAVTSASAAGPQLPITAYLISGAQQTEINTAVSMGIAACMRRFGFDFAPPVPRTDPTDSQTAERYAPTDLAVASTQGYHPEPVGTVAPAPSPQPLSAAMLKVLRAGPNAPGRTRQPAQYVHGISIPEGGCVGQAQAAVEAHGGIIQDAQAAVDINFSGYERSLTDSRLLAVFVQWSRCMKGRGFSYRAPRDADNDPRWESPAPSPVEIATAEADVACKQADHVVADWFAVESDYENREIAANLGSLNRIRASIATAVGNAQEVIRSLR